MKKTLCALAALAVALAAAPGLFAGEPDRGASFLNGAFSFPLRPALVSEDGAENAGAESVAAAAGADTPLTRAEKAEAYKWYALVLNMIPGFGIGSFVQGDWVGGLMCGIPDTLVYMYFVSYGFMYLATGGIVDSFAHMPKDPLLPLIIITFISARLIGAIRPFYYADQFKVDAVPTVDDRGNLGLTCSVRFRF
jgi:hypothetical protein